MTGNVIPYAVIFEANPALETNDPLFFELVAVPASSSSLYASLVSGGSHTDVNNKYYVPLVEDGLSAGAYNQAEFPVLAIQPNNLVTPGGPGTITSGTMYVTVIYSFF